MAFGTLAHVEIAADDTARARAFYEALLSWDFLPMAGFEDYWLFKAGQTDIGGLGRRGRGAGRHTRVYYTVASIDQAISTAQSLGGKVLEAKDEIPDSGWYAVVEDTEGNEVGLWQSQERTETNSNGDR